MNPGHTPDLHGEALKRQRFRMLEDIAEELSGSDVVFPTCFDIAIRIRQALRDSSQPIARIAEQLSVEPLIGSKLLRLANSTAFNPGGVEIRDVKTAITRLGLDIVRSTTLAITMSQMLRSREMTGFEEMAEHLWTHSLHTACAAHVIARQLSHVNPEEAMTAGLVHDLGAFYMLYRATRYPDLRERPDTLRHLIAQWHESIGLSVLNALGIPEEILDGVRDHDALRPVPQKPRTLNDVVFVANLLVGGRHEWMFLDLDADLEEDYKPGEQYLALLPEINDHLAQMQAVFN